jgi:DUF4097 and DUF4098 domain-containing protein YvlB
MKRSLVLSALLVLLFALPVSPALAESRLEKSLRLEPGGRFRLDTDTGSVTVTGGSQSGVHLVVTSRRRKLEDFLTLRFDEGTGSVTVTGRKRHRLFGFSGGSVHFEVRVPRETEVSVDTSGGGIELSETRGNAKLDTSGGGITVRNVTGELDADTSGGGIRLQRITGRVHAETSGGGIKGTDLEGPVEAETSGGPVELERVRGDLRAHSSGGGIRIVEAAGRVEADTSGGGIEASFARGNGRGGVLTTSGGGIKVTLDPQVDLVIDASGNSVRTELPIRVEGEISRNSLKGTLGKGGETLRLRTSGGGVRIQPL